MNIILENISEKPDHYSIVLTKPGVFFYVCFGFGNIAKNIEVHIESEGVEAHISGLIIGRTGTCSINTIQHHEAPNSMSNLHIKSILSGDANFSYKGMIKIDQHAQGSNAYQKNDNLLLCPHAHVDTKPELEILANDVKCSHGATIGRLNNEELFYLQSRGISCEESYRLALNGFAQDVILKIPDEQIRCTLNQFVQDTLVEAQRIVPL